MEQKRRKSEVGTVSTERPLVHVYNPSGYVGLMTLDAARLYAEHNPQTVIERAERPRSQQADDACKAAERREHTRVSDDQEHSAGVPWWMFIAFLAVYTYFIVTGVKASW